MQGFTYITKMAHEVSLTDVKNWCRSGSQLLKNVVGQAVFGDEGNKFTCTIIFFVKKYFDITKYNCIFGRGFMVEFME